MSTSQDAKAEQCMYIHTYIHLLRTTLRKDADVGLSKLENSFVSVRPSCWPTSLCKKIITVDILGLLWASLPALFGFGRNAWVYGVRNTV